MNGLKRVLNSIGDIMKFSIVIPVYKSEKYLSGCIESIVNQTYKDLEIILVDDGSPDNCPVICDEWAEKDERIKVIHKKNEGSVAARKTGFGAATGEYVGFVDCDDWIDKDMYHKVYDSIHKYNSDCVITQFFFAFNDRNVKSDYLLDKEFYSRDDIEKSVFPYMVFKGQYYRFGIFPNCWSKVFKREIVEKHIYDVDNKIRMGDDAAFVYPCLMECSSISFVDEALYYYRQNPESMTATYDTMLPETYYLPYKAVLDNSNDLGVDLSEQLPYYLLYMVNFTVRNEMLKPNSQTVKSTKKVLKEIISNSFVIDSAKKINLKILPVHTKMLAISLKLKSVTLLNLYLSLLRRFI